MKKSNSNKSKIGRNDPCTCGSGKKFKKCCLHKYWNARLDELSRRSVVQKTNISSLRPLTPADLRSFKVANDLLKKQQKG